MSVVLFLSGQTLGDALGGIGRSFRTAFEALGYDFVEVNCSDPESMPVLNATIATGNVEFALTFMGIGADLSAVTPGSQPVNVWERTRIPFISLFGDSPAYFFDRHILPATGFAGIYAFPEHLKLRKRLPAQRGALGNGPPRPLDLCRKVDIDFAAKKTGKLLFLKNGNDPNKLIDAWREGVSTATFMMLADLAAELAGSIETDKGDDIDALVDAYFRDRNLDVEHLLNLRLLFVAQLDDYLRRLKSTMIAEALLDFPVEIHGYNWEHIDFTNRRATYVYGGDYGASATAIRRSLGMIDMSPNTSLAPHERPLRAFGMHTLCLTNQQKFFEREFPDSEDFTFAFETEAIRSKVADVLARPARYVDIGVATAERFNKKFTAEASCEFLINTAAILRTSYGPLPPSFPEFFVWPPTRV